VCILISILPCPISHKYCMYYEKYYYSEENE
jgi:hypothetical protein